MIALRRIIPCCLLLLVLGLAACKSETSGTPGAPDTYGTPGASREVAMVGGCTVREVRDSVRGVWLYVVEGRTSNYPCGVAVVPERHAPVAEMPSTAGETR